MSVISRGQPQSRRQFLTYVGTFAGVALLSAVDHAVGHTPLRTPHLRPVGESVAMGQRSPLAAR